MRLSNLVCVYAVSGFCIWSSKLIYQRLPSMFAMQLVKSRRSLGSRLNDSLLLGKVGIKQKVNTIIGKFFLFFGLKLNADACR